MLEKKIVKWWMFSRWTLRFHKKIREQARIADRLAKFLLEIGQILDSNFLAKIKNIILNTLPRISEPNIVIICFSKYFSK